MLKIILQLKRLVWKHHQLFIIKHNNNNNNFKQKTGVPDFKTATLFLID